MVVSGFVEGGGGGVELVFWGDSNSMMAVYNSSLTLFHSDDQWR